MSQGQGSGTHVKERGFGSAFSVSISLSSGVNAASYNYWHVDLNAGSGWNEQAQCDGSPIVFLNLAEQRRPKYQAFFCDHNPNAAETLCRRIGGRGYVFQCDNSEILPIVSQRISECEPRPHYAVGSVVCDPNGYFGDAVPDAAIQVFAMAHPRIDLIFNLNIRTYRMGLAHVLKAQTESRKNAWRSKTWPSPREFPARFHRRHWLISNVSRTRGDRFIILIGRNYRTDGSRAMGHHALESTQGQDVLRDIDGTGDVLDSLRSLSKLSRLPRASGISSGSDDSNEDSQRDLSELWGTGD
jgi:hypothetical protein